MPAKYQGAFVGLGLSPGLALASRGALKVIEISMMTATKTKATTISLKIKFGMVGTFSSSLVSSSSGLRGMTRPPALRTRQKCHGHQNKKTGGNDCCMDGKENG